MPRNLLAVHGVKGLICAVGDGGKILHWTGGRYEPTYVQSPTGHDLTGVWVENERSAWAVGSRGTVLRWDGARWHKVALAARTDELHAVWGCESDGIWIGGQGCLFQHKEGFGGTVHQTDMEIVAIWGSAPNDIWYLTTGLKVIHWNGVTCAPLDLPGDEHQEFYAISGTEEGFVWAGGVNGALFYCDGETWIEKDSGTEDTISGVCCASPDNDVWVTTNGGQLRHWDGKTWTVATASIFGYLSAVCTVDGEVWAVGERGVVIRHRPGRR